MDEKGGRVGPDRAPGTMAEPARGTTWGAPDDVERTTPEGDPLAERVEGLPEHEDDRLRGADESIGAGVMAAGGTATETGTSMARDSDTAPMEDDENEGTTEDRAVFPVPPNR
jgi:hypothetical protein